MKIQNLTCGKCGKDWQRISQRGKKPKLCTSCRESELPTSQSHHRETKDLKPLVEAKILDLNTKLSLAKNRVPLQVIRITQTEKQFLIKILETYGNNDPSAQSILNQL
jgi:hypothetical protein